MTKMKKISVSTIKNEQFYRLPKFLFAGDFKKLSNDHRVCYAIMLERMSLSLSKVDNGLDTFVDDKGEVYFVYDQKVLADILCVSDRTVRKYIEKLESVNLLRKERTGRANRLYLLQPNDEFYSTLSNNDIADDRKDSSNQSGTQVPTSNTNSSKNLNTTYDKFYKDILNKVCKTDKSLYKRVNGYKTKHDIHKDTVLTDEQINELLFIVSQVLKVDVEYKDISVCYNKTLTDKSVVEENNAYADASVEEFMKDINNISDYIESPLLVRHRVNIREGKVKPIYPLDFEYLATYNSVEEF